MTSSEFLLVSAAVDPRDVAEFREDISDFRNIRVAEVFEPTALSAGSDFVIQVLGNLSSAAIGATAAFLWTHASARLRRRSAPEWEIGRRDHESVEALTAALADFLQHGAERSAPRPLDPP